MNAVRADEADDYCTDGAHQITGVLEGFRHGQNAGAQRTLQQMDEGVRVAIKWRARGWI